MKGKNSAVKRSCVLLALLISITMLTGCYTIGERKPIATILFSNGDEVKIRLYPDQAPNTVNNFIYLANSGFYDGSPVHRIVEYFVIQMGKKGSDPEQVNAGYYIKGEFSNNGFGKNELSHLQGTVSMARSASDDDNADKDLYNTASSQFFITLTDKTYLDGDYAAFGKVISGMKLIEQISKMDVDKNDIPRDEIYIKTLTVETFGKNYDEPTKIPIEDQ
ncbi:MAG: peptidylprolyl isomerase [Clostridiales bacterium]|nr:peptidylprolyl isomerase [Clostridiales bacterium]